MNKCKLCGQLCGLLVDWHSECWADYQQFIRADLVPCIRQLASEQPLLTMYAISPQFREDFKSITIRPE